MLPLADQPSPVLCYQIALANLLQSSFFKTFGRPITKVCLMAVFTYQLVFFGWTKLEQDEIRSERQGMSGCGSFIMVGEALCLANFLVAEISLLEAKVKDLQEGNKA